MFFVNRFGQIMSIISCRNIAKDEEILVSYNYELYGAPQWYKDLWQNHKRYDYHHKHLLFFEVKIYPPHTMNIIIYVLLVENVRRTREKE